MDSKLIPQPLVGILRNPTYHLHLPPPPPPAKLGFRRGTSFSASDVSARRVFQCSFRSNVSPILSASSKLGFFARAEADAEAGVGEVAADTEAEAENVGEVEGEDEKEEAEAEVKEPRKPRVKLGDVIGILNKRAIEASDKERPIPDIRPGDVLELKLVAAQKRRRFAIYKGIVISRQNAGIHSTIRVRRIIAGIGVEIVFPLYSPMVKEIKVVKRRKVRRAKLYYLRDKLPRFCTFK